MKIVCTQCVQDRIEAIRIKIIERCTVKYTAKLYPKNCQEMKCSYYRMKLWSRIKRMLIVILAIYLALCFIELIVSIL